MRRRYTGFITGLLFGVATSVLALSLVWTPPSQRTDGTSFSLSEIDHYNLYCGETLELAFITEMGSTLTRQPLEGILPDGDWFCAITVVDYLGLESDWSSVVSFTLGGGVIDPPNVARPNPPVINGAL